MSLPSPTALSLMSPAFQRGFARHEYDKAKQAADNPKLSKAYRNRMRKRANEMAEILKEMGLSVK